jgi:hypothetical protein
MYLSILIILGTCLNLYLYVFYKLTPSLNYYYYLLQIYIIIVYMDSLCLEKYLVKNNVWVEKCIERQAQAQY